ncbi:glycosyltransferase family 4 protein [Winogradskyella sp.]|nr:glycosyltransferase family 4 protein [Winogradskyella sp.]
MGKIQSICFALESFFPSQRAGTEVYVLNLCHYFKSNGWEVQVLIATTEEQHHYTYEGIPVYTFAVPKKATAQELNGIKPPRGIEAFKERLIALQPHWVHFHSIGRAINSYHIELAKSLGFKTAFTPHLGGTFCIKGNLRIYNKENCNGQVLENRCMSCVLQAKGLSTPIAKLLGVGISGLTHLNPVKTKLPPALFQAQHRKAELQRIKNHTDVIFAIAPWIQNVFFSNGFKNSILLPQGISPLFFKKDTRQHKPIQYPVQLVFVGRMHSSKGFHLLTQAWDALDLKGNRAQLHVITNPSGGETAYFEEHKYWAQQHNDVIWNEGFSQEQVANYFNDMDVLILPSISNEVAPLVILEAATRKIPTLASDYIAMKDSIQHGKDGWLFENGNAAALQNLMEDLITTPQKIIEVAANIKSPHSMDEVAAIVEEQFLLH